MSVCPKIPSGNPKMIWLMITKIGSITILYLKCNFEFIAVDKGVKSLYLLTGVMKILSLCYRPMFY